MKLKFALSLIIALAFLSVLFYLVPFGQLLSSVSSVPKPYLLYGFVAYTLSQVVRSLRWYMLIPQLGAWRAFLINSANILLNNVVPARAGELSWFYYTRRQDIPLKESLWVFVAARVYDLLGLILLFVAYGAYIRGGALLALSVSLILLVANLLVPKLSELLPPTGRLKDMKDFLRERHTLKVSLLLTTTAAISFFFKFLSMYLIISHLSEVSFMKAMLAFAGGDLTTILPVHSFMGYGTYEGGFLLPLKLFGVELREGLKLGFIAHNFLLLSSIALGIPSLLFLHLGGRRVG